MRLWLGGHCNCQRPLSSSSLISLDSFILTFTQRPSLFHLFLLRVHTILTLLLSPSLQCLPPHTFWSLHFRLSLTISLSSLLITCPHHLSIPEMWKTHFHIILTPQNGSEPLLMHHQHSAPCTTPNIPIYFNHTLPYNCLQPLSVAVSKRLACVGWLPATYIHTTRACGFQIRYCVKNNSVFNCLFTGKV
jgi:hypothetical protein